MIASLNGYMAAKSAASVVLEINGIGYEVAIPLTVMDKLPTIGEKVFLLIEFVVREESQTLYGFLDETTRALSDG